MRILLPALAFVAAILPFLSGCSSQDKKPQGMTEQEVYQQAQKSLDSSNWQNAIKTLELLEENFPFGTYGEQAQLELIYAHYRAGNYDEVPVNAERFIRLHPQHRNVDYAYYLRGMASFHKESSFMGSLFGTDNTTKDPGAARESYDHFMDLINHFPNSPYAADAQKRMIYLRNALARLEIHVANYYFKRGAFLAALKRGNYVVENFQETPSVPDALAVMAQAYYLIGKPELATESIKVLAANFPEHPALSKDGNFDEKYIATGKRSWVSYLTLGLFDKNEVRGFDTREIYNSEYIPEPES